MKTRLRLPSPTSRTRQRVGLAAEPGAQRRAGRPGTRPRSVVERAVAFGRADGQDTDPPDWSQPEAPMAECRLRQFPSAMAVVGRGWTCRAKLAILAVDVPCPDRPSDDANPDLCGLCAGRAAGGRPERGPERCRQGPRADGGGPLRGVPAVLPARARRGRGASSAPDDPSVAAEINDLAEANRLAGATRRPRHSTCAPSSWTRRRAARTRRGSPPP